MSRQGRKEVLLQGDKKRAGHCHRTIFTGKYPNEVSVIETPILIPTYAVEVAQAMSVERLTRVLLGPQSDQGQKRKSYLKKRKTMMKNCFRANVLHKFK